MKRIISLIILLITLITTTGVKAFNIETSNDLNINILSSTKTFTITNEYTDIYYNTDKLILINNEFHIIDPTTTRIIIKNNDDLTTINLNFVSPTVEEISLKKNNDYYYVYYNNEILYGDFNFIVDDKEVTALCASGNVVSLNYNDSIITINSNNNRSIFSEYFILILGLSLLFLIILYLVYLFIPKNYYKKLTKYAKKILNYYQKDRSNKQILFDTKVGLINISTAFRGIPSSDPKYDEIKNIINKMNLAMENLLKIDYFKNNYDIKDYFKFKLELLIKTLDNGNYSYKEKKEEVIKKINILKPEQMDKEQEDAYHYLEGIGIINKKDKN